MRLVSRSVLAVLLAVFLTSTAMTGSAGASFPGRDGKIAYVLGPHVYTVNPDGSGVRRLTVDGRNAGPRWSPDGTRIAFTRNKNVWVMNADGTGKRQVTSSGRDLQPAWSRDGRQLVFVRLQSNGRGDLFRMPVTGGPAKRLTFDASDSGGNARPTWSPTQDLVLYLHYDAAGMQDAVIKTINVATGLQRVVPAGVPNQERDFVDAPDFTADGQHILFLAFCTSAEDWSCPPATTQNIMLSDLTTAARQDLTGNSGVDGSDDILDVAASPSGTGFVAQGCYNFNIDRQPPAYDFCGIRPGNVRGASNPDWQPRR
jgi:dipeptidyl aminopeptidase/acylaminoacyl peptidase